MSSRKSTIVRARTAAFHLFFATAGAALPPLSGRIARDLWFTAPPRMAAHPVPAGGERFEVDCKGHAVVGTVWGEPTCGTVYLVHGWGGRGSQLAAMVEPLVASGYRVVVLDGPNHGASAHGPAGPRRTHGVELAKALDAVFCRYGPAEAVVAHSLGVVATYLALRFGWLGTQRLVAIAPMVESRSLFDRFQATLGFGERTRRAFDRSLLAWVGIPVAEFDARFQAAQVEPVPTLVITDRGDRQTRYDDVVDYAASVRAPLVTTHGLGHRKILSDPGVVAHVVDFLGRPVPEGHRPAALDVPRIAVGT